MKKILLFALLLLSKNILFAQNAEEILKNLSKINFVSLKKTQTIDFHYKANAQTNGSKYNFYSNQIVAVAQGKILVSKTDSLFQKIKKTPKIYVHLEKTGVYEHTNTIFPEMIAYACYSFSDNLESAFYGNYFIPLKNTLKIDSSWQEKNDNCIKLSFLSKQKNNDIYTKVNIYTNIIQNIIQKIVIENISYRETSIEAENMNDTPELNITQYNTKVMIDYNIISELHIPQKVVSTTKRIRAIHSDKNIKDTSEIKNDFYTQEFLFSNLRDSLWQKNPYLVNQKNIGNRRFYIWSFFTENSHLYPIEKWKNEEKKHLNNTKINFIVGNNSFEKKLKNILKTCQQYQSAKYKIENRYVREYIDLVDNEKKEEKDTAFVTFQKYNFGFFGKDYFIKNLTLKKDFIFEKGKYFEIDHEERYYFQKPFTFKGEPDVNYSHNELFLPLVRSEEYFNSIFEILPKSKTKNLIDKKINGEICEGIEIIYPQDSYSLLNYATEILYFRKKDFLPVYRKFIRVFSKKHPMGTHQKIIEQQIFDVIELKNKSEKYNIPIGYKEKIYSSPFFPTEILEKMTED